MWPSLAFAAPVAQVVSTAGPITVDGALDEAAWADAPPVTAFARYQPVDGGPPAGLTEVRFLQDERALYIGVRVSGVDYRVRARPSPRELLNADDQIGLYLDTFDDQRTGYVFYTNPLGVQQDIRHNNGRWNVDWDTQYRTRGRVTDDGYELEIALPWRSVRYPSGGDEQEWGLIITRKIPSEGAKYSFPQTERNHPRLFQQAARLVGVRPGSRGTGLELAPALTLADTKLPPPPPGAPPPGPEPALLRPSLDARYAITPDLGAALTLNPDFSQVESDIRDVRLNARFAYQFPERRPFFLDGIDAFEDRPSTLYTRSIAEPLYGVKLSGRQDGLSVGLVHALDRAPLPSFHERGAPGFDADDVDGALASTTMARVQQDAFGAGYVGFTVADKRLIGRSGHFDIGALDMVAPLGDRWVAGWSSAHSVTGERSGSALDVLWGQQNEASLVRASGVGTGVDLSVLDRGDGFRNEVGFVNQSALTRGAATVDHTFTPGGRIDTITPSLTGVAQEERNPERDHYRELSTRPVVVVDGVHSVWVGGGLTDVRERLAQAPGRFATVGYSGQVGAVIEWTPQLTIARGFDYALLEPADDLSAAVDLTLRAGGLRVDTTGRLDRHRPLSAAPQRASFWRTRVNAQFNRSLGVRLVTEHTDGTELDTAQLRTSALLTWLYVPGTAAYLGVSEDLSLDGSGRSLERSLFAKVSVLWRP
jgi:hypothetical protein